MELYIHIPFCVQKCRYCDFVSFPCSEEAKKHYIDLVLSEARERAEHCVLRPFDTVYIGGGTPSLLSPELLTKLIRGLREILPMDKVSEFSVECNPGTVKEEWLSTALELGINRFSVGVQAYQDSLLKMLGRIHRFEDVLHTVELFKKHHVSNYNLDLMFGLPRQTPEQWAETLNKVLSLEPAHLSVYGLIPEDNTLLKKDLDEGVLVLPEPETERDMYYAAKQLLAEKGFRQYEISNFALPGKECRHNIGYWTQVPYLGLGLAASSMLNVEMTDNGIRYQRTVNPADMRDYEALVEKKESKVREIEEILPEDATFETVMLRLRMNKGIDDREYERLHGHRFSEKYDSVIKRYLDLGLMQVKDGCYSLTDAGFDIQNSILVDFME